MERFFNLLSPLKQKVKNILFPEPIVLVYTMGKVGSSSIYSTIKKNLTKIVVYQPHFLSDYYLEKVLPNTNHYEHNKNVADQVFKTLNSNNKKRLKIISLVRDPIARDISNIFENPIDFVGDNKLEDYSLDNLIDIYNSKENHNYTLSWFDDEFLNYTEVDIFKLQFDTSKGYEIYKLDSFDLLIIKMEKLNKVGCEAINKLLKTNIQKLALENSTDQKTTSSLSRQFKQKYKADKKTLDKIYSSKLVKHFYNDNEINRFKTGWQEKTS